MKRLWALRQSGSTLPPALPLPVPWGSMVQRIYLNPCLLKFLARGPLQVLSSCSVNGGPSAEFSPSPLSGFLPSHALSSFPLPFPLPPAPPPPSRPDSSQSLGLPLPQGAFPQNPPAAWLVLTVLLYPSRSHPQSTKPSPEALNPSFIAHSSLVLHKSEIEKFSEKVKKTPQSLLGAAKACGVPHSHPARAGKSPCLWPLASLLSGPHPAPRPGAQDGKQASSQSGSRKGAVNHLDPAAI